MSKKRTLIAIGGALVVLAAVIALATYFFRHDLRLLAMRPIGEAEAPPAPDYSLPQSWSRWAGSEQDGKFDIFYVHPMTYTSRGSWNAPFDADSEFSDFHDSTTLQHHDFTMDGVRLYAPRYRQATYYATRNATQRTRERGMEALTLAYQDIERAFRAFLVMRDPNRPFVIIGKEQGALHAATLLERFFAGDDNALRKNLAVALLSDWPIADVATDGQSLPKCNRQETFRCMISNFSRIAGVPARLYPLPVIWQSDKYVVAPPATLILDMSASPEMSTRVDALLAALEEEAQILAPIENAVEIGDSPINKVPD